MNNKIIIFTLSHAYAQVLETKFPSPATEASFIPKIPRSF